MEDITMNIPPFPSQDLAKLVLGYLAEEQLMTAYDEFLQASPYLDALGNEYDRIFMTSLKSILAEYRAVKIYVETCKPFTLRKKIFQCTNLLEMVKFLVQNVDLNKLQESNLTKNNIEKQNSITSVKNNICDVCSSLKLENCTCKIKNNVSCLPSSTHTSTSLENSIETTPLSDLPGNHVTCRKKNAKLLNKDWSEVHASSDLNISSLKLPASEGVNEGVKEKPDTLEMKQKEEFNSILNQVCNKNKVADTIVPQIEDTDRQTKASTSGYDDFATGVESGGSVPSESVPDSSTSENLHVQIPTAKETNKLSSVDTNAKVGHTTTQYLLKVAGSKKNGQPKEVVSINTCTACTFPRKKLKPDESKIKILSDVKVDKQFNNSDASCLNMPSVLKNATSTPLLQMRTIVINGTPVYKHIPFGQNQSTYTKDEIMAMPTIILAPASGSSQVPVSQSAETSHPSTGQYDSTNAPGCSARPLGPLIIDVSSARNSCVENVIDVNNQNMKTGMSPVATQKEEMKQSDVTVTKPIDITSASAPKDTTVTGTTETSTPQVLPPLRKSSSTPRRTSHVRVLDFTTPRRILHETINKCVPYMALDSDNEVILSKSPNVSNALATDKINESNKLDEVNGRSFKENTAKKIVKNWDADLRMLATVSELDTGIVRPCSPKFKPKPKSTKKSKVKGQTTKDKKTDKIGSDKTCAEKRSAKVKLLKDKTIDEDMEIITIPDDKVDLPVKPTINIIAGVDRNPSTSAEINKSQNKSNNDDNIDTPELERMSLQNEIGAKLNISDLLETPYKQAMYDIQMETPRFLGPDIPDDPMSDIKIMNIPTPRFLNATTPSSYSSRPTDYSSGGSYYKPEEQDYMRVHEELDCPVTSTKATSLTIDQSSNRGNDDYKEKENLKPTRPVRECTKNVSYNLGNLGTRNKNIENRTDTDSSIDSAIEKPIIPVTPKIKENKSKSEISKKGSTKKRKTPAPKETTKSFMKIKPRRPTPTKNSVKGKRKPVDPSDQSKVQTRKKIASKESSVSSTPVINSVPTKSRRKSSTPRKLHCSKSFHSESSGHDSPEFISKSKENVPESGMVTAHDSDEQLPLRWSDDGSQEPQPVLLSIPNDTEDIMKIKEYIETSVGPKQRFNDNLNIHIDLVKTGFDLASAKTIEKDLLDTPPHLTQENAIQEPLTITPAIESENIEIESKFRIVLDKTLESDTSASNNLQIVQTDEEEDEEIELSVHECNEESTNYFSFDHDENAPKTELAKLKDKFCMEVCIDDGVSIRLRATPFSVMLDQDPQAVEYLNYSYRETEMAVSSISNFDKLYTPLKESIKAQCYEIFDSTLTSLDTPLKARSPKKVESEVTVTKIVLEVEEIEEKEKVDTKKRKRAQSGNVSDEGVAETKKAKADTQLLFNSTNIQNFDIDSVLSKLHGP